MECYICFDIGGTAIKHGLLDSNAQIITKGQLETNAETASQFIDNLAIIVEAYEKQADILGIGISFPGFIDTHSGQAYRAGALSVLDGMNVPQLLKEKLCWKSYPIKIENDANCAAIAEKFNGAAQKVSDFILMTIGTGIGGAVFINNQIVRGKKFRAGEFGIMPLNESQNLHELASTRGLIKLYKKEMNLPETKIITGEMIFDRRHDLKVNLILKKWAGYVATGIYNVNSVLNPEKILIGGGISKNPYLLTLIKDEVCKLPCWKMYEVPIEICQHHNDAGLIGAWCILVGMKLREKNIFETKIK